MSRRIYISSDYDEGNGDRNVVEEFYRWNDSNRHSLEFVDLARVVSGSVSDKPDCRICDLKNEFNKQINSASAVIFVIGDKTKDRTAGSACSRFNKWSTLGCTCTPYKQNAFGAKPCKISYLVFFGPGENVEEINSYSYLRHEFEQAKKKGKQIIIVYNSLRRQPKWLPSYMTEYADQAEPFWIETEFGNRIGNYEFIKKKLGYL
jgi:hypothetical protein